MKLIQIEWRKIKSYNTFRTLIIIYLAAVPLMNLGVAQFDLPSMLSSTPILGFPTVYGVTAWLASCLNLLMGIIIVSITSNEYMYKTLRQNLIDGLTKQELILAKFWVILLLSTGIALYTFLVAFVTGVLTSGFEHVMNGASYVAVYFIQTLGYFSLAFFFAVVLKRSSLAIIVFILTILFDGITVGLAIPQKFFVYFPTEVFSNLTPFPFLKEMIDKAKNGGENIVVLSTWIGVALSLAYSGLLLFFSYKLIQKKDI